MKLFINGEAKYFSCSTLSAVMEQEGWYERKAAVAVNGQFVPKGQHMDVALKDGDQLEILTPMQGG